MIDWFKSSINGINRLVMAIVNVWDNTVPVYHPTLGISSDWRVLTKLHLSKAAAKRLSQSSIWCVFEPTSAKPHHLTKPKMKTTCFGASRKHILVAQVFSVNRPTVIPLAGEKQSFSLIQECQSFFFLSFFPHKDIYVLHSIAVNNENSWIQTKINITLHINITILNTFHKLNVVS